MRLNTNVNIKSALFYTAAALLLFLPAGAGFAQNIDSVRKTIDGKTDITVRSISGEAENRVSNAAGELETAIIQLHSAGVKTPPDSLIKKIQNIIKKTAGGNIAKRAELELASAYIKKGEYSAALPILNKLSADNNFEFRSKASEQLNYAHFLIKRAELHGAAVKNLNELRKAKKEFEAIPVSSAAAKLKANLKLTAAAEKFRRSLAAYQAHTTKDGLKAYAGYALDGLFKGGNIDPENPAFAKMLNLENRFSDVQRSPEIIEKKGDILKVLNVRWGFEDFAQLTANKPVWRSASIDASKVTDVYFCLKPFPPEWLVAHAFLIFELEEKYPMTTTDGKASRGLILSVEPKYRSGSSYGSPQLENPMYIVFQLSSREDYLGLSAVTKSKAIYPFRLKLDKNQKKELLKKAIEASWTNIPETNTYSLLENNCINNLFMIINRILPDGKKYKKDLEIAFNPNVSTPQLCVSALDSFGLLAEKAPAVNLFSGRDADSKPAGAEKIAAAEAAITTAKTAFLSAVDEGSLNAQKTRKILFDEITGTASCLYVPPVKPFTANAGEFTAGKEFREKLSGASDAAKLKLYTEGLFAAYLKAVKKRMEMQGPDISGFIKKNMNDLKKRIQNSK
jgi:tetratricopeptide (TPR) repeat protein